jgi:hypothetical protein
VACVESLGTDAIRTLGEGSGEGHWF